MANVFDYLDSDIFELLLIYVQKARMKRVLYEILENSNHYWCWRSKSVVWPHLNKRGSVASYGYHDIYSYYLYGDIEYYTRISRGFNIKIIKRCIAGGICSKIYQQKAPPTIDFVAQGLII